MIPKKIHYCWFGGQLKHELAQHCIASWKRVHPDFEIIEWNENPAILISNALSPSKVMRVEVDADDNSALVVVPDYQLSLAIGKEGQNARLAAKLTGWKIDIKSETQYIDYLKEIGEYEEVYGD